MNSYTSKLTLLESQYQMLHSNQALVNNNLTQIERLRAELPDEILCFYDQLRVINKLKGDQV